MLRHGEVLDNARYRAATGIGDSRIATAELQDLVAREVVAQLAPGAGVFRRPDRRTQIINALKAHEPLTKIDLAERISVSPKTAEHWLRILRREGVVSVEGGRGQRHTVYRLRGPQRMA